ncbi:RHS repeat-associated core domain-containing protein [Streptomyces sp. NBC_00878]|uniref:RHS repeat-associated core domain-containing protein n=1 Tax=Streptomyces sp. NBC_00878 TaxID=2975854 RepID=UPI00224FA0DE|nr:RHS repeat-associated core domain-containing protein [Streptomyces sp. NBC_00878]MCX4905730.1 RHS repeat-associated core domain-containing protein [Streptomyces sp. NBC_00878]
MPALSLALIAPVAQASLGTPAVAADGSGRGLPDVPKQRVSKVSEFEGLGAKEARAHAAKDRKANVAQGKQARREQQATWPKQGSATLTLREGRTDKAALAGIPVSLEPTSAKRSDPAAGKADIAVLGQKAADKAGVTGVLFTAAVADPGRARIKVDYSDFATALGGGWSQRLRLVQLPACALTTPTKATCREQTPLKSDNDIVKQSVSAQIALAGTSGGGRARLSSAASPGTVFALTAAAVGGESPTGLGTYSATELAPSSAWQAGSSSGSFTWSYDFAMPSAAAGPAPELSLSYDSGSIDGRTATTNNQGSAIGEGFSLTESYIERTYGSCDDDGQEDVFDSCWKYDNAQLVLNGKSTRLVKISGDWDSTWRLADDDASTVTRSTSADNGDDNGEYWTVITGDGTKYVFGLNTLDGAADQRTNSTWTVPVFGDDSGEPGYSSGSAFGDRSKTQAWRWNLDYVEDTRGNASTNWYTKETNHYKKNKAETANTSYTRGGYLKEIKYGLRKDALFTDDADAKVTFEHAERCTVADCAELTKDTAKNWPDVPFEAICSDGDTECNSAGPSFFSRKRLTGINAYSWATTTKTYAPVDSWTLTQDYKDAGDIGDTTDHVLVLESIKRTAKAGTDIPVNPVSFTYQLRPNRVDGTDDILPMKRHRISTITSETGAITEVTLSAPECKRSEMLDAPQDANTRSCYPQYWHINGGENASVDWFHKYRVQAVMVSDPATNNEPVLNDYDYTGAAWHHADDPFTPKDERTWSDWRGYRQVTVHTGADQTNRSKTVSLYLQGMDGDKKEDGTTRSVTLAPLAAPDLGIAGIADSDPYAGQLRQQVTYDGAMAISAQVNEPWSKETATQSVPDAADHAARFVRTKKSTTHTYLTVAKKWRAHSVVTGYDNFGMAQQVEDLGDDANSGDETCTVNWYARNTDAGLTRLTSRTRVVGKACSVTNTTLDLPTDSSRRGDVLSDTATAYDGAATWSADMKPTKGLATWSGRANAYPTKDTVIFQKVTATAYDSLGRPTSATNADGKVTTTAYSPTASGPLTQTITTNAKSHRTVSFLDPRRSAVLRSYDANNKKTELAYDALGRLTAVWLPNRTSSGDAPNSKFVYHLDNKDESWVSSSTLKKDGTSYNTNYTIYDSLLRPLQNQSPTPQGGRLLTDTRYDTRGLAYETYADIFDPEAAPNGTYTRAEYGQAPTQTATAYDGAGRTVSSTLLVFGVKKWTTSTSYTGNSTATTALEGGAATRTVTDARGRTIETREYAGTTPADPEFGDGVGTSYTSTKFGFTLDDKPQSITGPDGAEWSYTYDLFGLQRSASDPDKGTTRADYNVLDQVIKATDARGKSIVSEYDEVGRLTGTWAGSKTDANQLTAQTYDTALKGKPTSSTRYVGGKTGQAYTDTVTDYDNLSRPVASKLELPADDPFVKAGAPAVLGYTNYYNLDGTLQNSKEPALGGLPSEIIDFGYNGLGQVTSIGGATGYLLDTSYTALGQPLQLTLGTANTEDHKKTYVTNTYEQGTGRLTRSHTDSQTAPYVLQDLNYTYDEAGNVTSIADPTTVAGTSAETQCFAYDGHRRLTEAWTPASQKCTDGRNASSLSGPAPYWTSYTYNSAGQRTSETKHQSGGDTKTTYCYKSAQPHALTGTSTKADCTSPDRSYQYNATGDTLKRPGTAGNTQDLAWSEEGKLTKLTENGKATDYLYDTTGELLIRNTQDGERILYAGTTELHLKADGTLWAQRYYAAGGMTVAVRTNESGTSKLSYLTGDHHGTSSLTISADSSQTVSKRYMTAFGAERGKPAGAAWPDDKGFLGKTNDTTTGLTHIGAREYDPAVGQFISVDPLLTLDQQQSLNGYAYANNNPATYSDPTGQKIACGPGTDTPCPKDDSNGDGVTNPGSPNTNRPGSGTSSSGSNGGGGGSVEYPAPAPSGGCGFWDVKCGWNDLWKSDCGFWDVKCSLHENYEAWKTVLAPDTEDLEGCGRGELDGCGWLIAGFLPAGKLKKLSKLLDGGEDAKKAAKKIDEAIELVGQIPYGEGHLSSAVQLQRILDNKKNGNYASALLDDGTTLVAHSDSTMHSEEYLLERAGKRKIVAAYSERAPCDSGHNCASQLRTAGVKNVSWSFPWNGIGDAGRAKTNRDLTAAVKNLFNGK